MDVPSNGHALCKQQKSPTPAATASGRRIISRVAAAVSADIQQAKNADVRAGVDRQWV